MVTSELIQEIFLHIHKFHQNTRTTLRRRFYEAAHVNDSKAEFTTGKHWPAFSQHLPTWIMLN